MVCSVWLKKKRNLDRINRMVRIGIYKTYRTYMIERSDVGLIRKLGLVRNRRGIGYGVFVFIRCSGGDMIGSEVIYEGVCCGRA